MKEVSTDKKSKQKGVILIIVALILVIIVGIVAFVFDANRAAASIEQARHYARLAALGAAEEYFDQVRKGTNDVPAYKEALDRANTMSDFNKMLGDVSQAKIVEKGGKGADLIPGQWRTDPMAADSNPCKKKPCFFELKKSDLGKKNRATAFKVVGQLFPTGVLMTFAKIAFAQAAISVNVSAVASVIPRHGCFLIDNSGSMVSETHSYTTGYDADKGIVTASGYDYALTPNPDVSTLHQLLWNGMAVTRPADKITAPVPTVHYQSDYVTKLVLGNDNYGLSDDFAKYHPAAAVDTKTGIDYRTMQNETVQNAPYPYRVDVFRQYNATPNKYLGPEPLRTVFSGLRAAAKRFDKRSVAGDKMCFIFYDSRLSWPRVIKLTDDFEYLNRLTDFDLAFKAGAPVALTNDTGTAITTDMFEKSTGLELLIRHGLFPHAGANTNTPLALSSATRQLRQEFDDTGIPSSDFLVHLGDGMSNCSTALGCKNDYAHFAQSMADLRSAITKPGGLFESRLPMHFIATGSHIRPHTVDIPKTTGSTECFTDDQWRSNASKLTKNELYGFVSGQGNDATTFATASGDNPFYYANRKMYEFSILTTGLYGPIRPPRSKVMEGDKEVCPPINCGKDDNGDTILGADGKYIRIKDPNCRSEEDQINAYVDKIIGDNPFAIVQVE